MLPSDYACPRCKCRACYALHRKGIDWVVSVLGLRPARCLTCTRRFYARYTMEDNEKNIVGAPTYLAKAVGSKPQVDGKRKSLNTAA